MMAGLSLTGAGTPEGMTCGAVAGSGVTETADALGNAGATLGWATAADAVSPLDLGRKTRNAINPPTSKTAKPIPTTHPAALERVLPVCPQADCVGEPSPGAGPGSDIGE